MFEDCAGLKSVLISESVKNIGYGAFISCKSLNAISYNAIDCTVSDGKSLFSYCPNVKTLTIGKNVVKIPNRIFSGFTNLTSVEIPNSVTSIERYAFSSCTGMEHLSIGNSVKSIGNDAFSDCPRLTSITIPNSVSTIGNYAFFGCSGLTEFVSNAVVPPVCGSGAFDKIDKHTCKLIVPQESVELYTVAPEWCEFYNPPEYDSVSDVGADDAEVMYDVYDMRGVRVAGGLRETEANAERLPRGVYILVSPQGRKKLKI